MSDDNEIRPKKDERTWLDRFLFAVYATIGGVSSGGVQPMVPPVVQQSAQLREEARYLRATSDIAGDRRDPPVPPQVVGGLLGQVREMAERLRADSSPELFAEARQLLVRVGTVVYSALGVRSVEEWQKKYDEEQWKALEQAHKLEEEKRKKPGTDEKGKERVEKYMDWLETAIKLLEPLAGYSS